MGNCLVLQEKKKLIKIMKADGGSPLKVNQSLSEFPGCAISDVRHLEVTTDARRGEFCYLLPPKAAAVAKTDLGAGVVRIKLVISKQELKEMLRAGGVSLDGVVFDQLQREASRGGESDEEERCIWWRPALESIPEGNDSY